MTNKLANKAKKFNIVLDEKNRSVLDMVVKDDSSFLSDVYFDNPTISSDVGDLLEAKKLKLKWKKGVVINIHSNCIEKEKEQIYQDAIHSYFSDKYRNVYVKHKITYFIAIIFMILGIITFGLLFGLSNNFQLGPWEEVIDVVAWVFVWEAVDLFVIQGLIDKTDRAIYKNLMNAEINVLQDKTNSEDKK